VAYFYPTVDYPGINVIEVSRVANPNYLFITLNITQDASPGEFLITLVRDGQNKVFRYELQPRETDPERINPVDPSDLIYLLMPDRFANGDPSNDSFGDMAQTGIDRSKMFFRHGGDLQGIIDHLDYLEELGITTLWLNPVQENDQPYESYHGYAITDHYNIDKRFGDNALYKQLVDECQKRGMKVIMDVIYNHVGDNHWFINDLPAFDWIHQFTEFKRTTYRAPTLMDPYASYYDKMMMADGWFDYHMPDLNQKNEKLATYLIQNSIWWVEYAGLDGYRVDTYAYPDQDFMGQWVKAIKEEYPDFHMYAETWVHGTPIQAYFADNAMELASTSSPIEAVTYFQVYYAIKVALTEEQGWKSAAARV
jgi:glycosidase